jgi:hypothetical protein
MDSVKKQVVVVGIIYAFDLISIILFGPILRWI